MDLRYLHGTHVEPGEQSSGVAFTQTFPGWIDADAVPWAKFLFKPGECGFGSDCPCNTPPTLAKEQEG